MGQKQGRHSIMFDSPPVICSAATVAGPIEGGGMLGADYDRVYKDTLLGEKSFEVAERKMLLEACHLALSKKKYRLEEIDFFLAGDLLNQITVSGFSAARLDMPFFGIYGACSTLCLGLIWGAILVSGGLAANVLVATSSHNSCSERQYRYPTEYGFKRPPHSQWTVTGAGAAVVSSAGEGPRITACTIGKVIDAGEKDPAGLGLSMAPAAALTLVLHFKEMQRGPEYYDLILTGDLGKFGKKINEQVVAKHGFNLADRYNDCALMIYNFDRQPVEAGASGCAAPALVGLGHIYRRMITGDLKKVLLVATGALHSPTTCLQGDSIPAIAHAVALEM
jgi:stage V sporulation protein AD